MKFKNKIINICLLLILFLFVISCAMKSKTPAIQEAKSEKPAMKEEVKPAELPAPVAPTPVEVERKSNKSLSDSDTEMSKQAEVIPKMDKKTEKPMSSGGLKAGVADDNKQFNYYLNFLKKYEDVPHISVNINERILLKIKDASGKSAAEANVTIYCNNNEIEKGKTYADGSYFFYPSIYNSEYDEFIAKIRFMQDEKKVKFKRDGQRILEIKMSAKRNSYNNVPIDILFIMDTTGSMSEEINRLKSTIDIINMNISSFSSKPKVRFGMVLYRDKMDEYLTKIIPFSSNLEEFSKSLAEVSADGGGDTPEDLQTALSDTMNKLGWNKDGVRIGFIVTDAPAHLDYGQEYTYINASADAKRKAIKLFSIGTGGLDISGEYILRQISQYTYAKYIFLTYGEKEDSEGGAIGSVSHHVGNNYQTDKLESLIIKIAKEELSYLTDQPIEAQEDFFEAIKIEDEKKDDTMLKLFNQATVQLVDYSTVKIQEKTPLAILPATSNENKKLKSNAEYFNAQLTQSLNQNSFFKVVERTNIQGILDELKLNMAGLVDDKNAVKAGKMLGAQMILSPNLMENDKNYILFLKLIKVDTGEILSITKLMIDKNLGI
ncbi:MAG: VWA domain-containing protein [Desulfobacterales bacterium]|nr:VWA domain-containing protein [Desulfobacterales bacterium]MBF0395398.1 VWA domain-containing protein [Desulfobacterales bacterium]